MHACVCMHACAYLCMHVRTYVRMYVCMYVCDFIYIIILLLFHIARNTGININIPILWGSCSQQQVIPEGPKSIKLLSNFL